MPLLIIVTSTAHVRTILSMMLSAHVTSVLLIVWFKLYGLLMYMYI